jgi:hypothetical protein
MCSIHDQPLREDILLPLVFIYLTLIGLDEVKFLLIWSKILEKLSIFLVSNAYKIKIYSSKGFQ